MDENGTLNIVNFAGQQILENLDHKMWYKTKHVITSVSEILVCDPYFFLTMKHNSDQPTKVVKVCVRWYLLMDKIL